MATSRRSSIEVARLALAEISARNLPAEPKIYEVFYAYAAGERPDINRVIDAAASAHGRLARADIEDIHRRFFPVQELAERVERTRDTLTGEVNQIVAMIEAAAGWSGQHGQDFEDIGEQLIRYGVDRDTLRLIVETLIGATREVEDENAMLGLDLKKSHAHILNLRNDLVLVREESLTDALTGLPNRRHFDQLLGAAIAESLREQEPFCLLLVDIDHFKTFNDAYGHQTGDFVLRLVAQELTRSLKRMDIVARYGGEEFAIILPQTALRPAAIAADNVRRAIGEKKVMKRSTGEELGRVLVSAGLAEFRFSESMGALIDRADACLYEAKALGRNRVVDEVAFDKARAQTMMKAG